MSKELNGYVIVLFDARLSSTCYSDGEFRHLQMGWTAIVGLAMLVLRRMTATMNPLALGGSEKWNVPLRKPCRHAFIYCHDSSDGRAID